MGHNIHQYSVCEAQVRKVKLLGFLVFIQARNIIIMLLYSLVLPLHSLNQTPSLYIQYTAQV